MHPFQSKASAIATQQSLADSHPSFVRSDMNETPSTSRHGAPPVVHVGFNTFYSPTRSTTHQPNQSQRYMFAMSGGPASDGDDRSSDNNDLQTQRFVAGEQFYNYEMYGSLRKGSVVTFFSWYCFGLLAATFSSVLAYSGLQSVVRQYIALRLQLTPQQVVAVQRLIELPMALSFFVGLLTDGYPLMGLRRKGYMVVGLVMHAVSILALGGISMYIETLSIHTKPAGWLVVLALVLISLASFGCIITYLCVHTRTIELSQREPLRKRGAIIAEYLIFRRLVSFVAAGYSILALGPTGSLFGKQEPRLAFSTALFVLAFVCAAPLPIVLRYWKEEHYNLSTTLHVRGKIFWKIMQQKAVWRVLMFIVIFAFFLTMRINDTTNAVKRWAGSYDDNYQLTRSIADGVAILTYIVWRLFFMNTRWPQFYSLGPVLQIVPNLVANIIVAMNVSRDRYLYRSITTLANVADAVLALNPIVPLIEIIQEGSEGATVGLTLSLQRLIQIFVSTNAQGLFRGDMFYDVDAVKADSSAGREGIVWASVFIYGINALALLGLFFLPSQKLDAQQLRMYGGFTKAASSAIVVFCVALFLYSTTINVMSFVPSVSCFRLVGGQGCDKRTIS